MTQYGLNRYDAIQLTGKTVGLVGFGRRGIVIRLRRNLLRNQVVLAAEA